MSRSNSGKRRHASKVNHAGVATGVGVCAEHGKQFFPDKKAAKQAARRLFPKAKGPDRLSVFSCGTYVHLGARPQPADDAAASLVDVYGG